MTMLSDDSSGTKATGDRPEVDDESSLAGRMLIAMPNIGDPQFERTLIYLFAHETDGAMGLIVNRPNADVTFPDLLSQLDVEVSDDATDTLVRFGGPVQIERGFVLHSPDYHREEATLRVDDAISMTATLDVLHAIAAGRGPNRALFALGYAGWGPGQLEREIQQNGWLHCDGDAELVFDGADDTKWSRALAKIGVDPSLLSAEAGRA